MKLFVIAALVAVAAAGRLEPLERSYLPPDSNTLGSARSSVVSNGFGSGHGGFGSPSSHGGFGSQGSHGGFGSQGSHGGFGSQGSHGGFGSHGAQGSLGGNSGAFSAAGAGLARNSAGRSFVGATSNQYLPPNHGSASNGAHQFAGSQGIGGQNFRSQYREQQAAPSNLYGTPQAAPSTQYGAPQARSFGGPSQGQYSQQSSAASRQYLAPKTSFQNTPQQPFDEQTGYHY